MDDATVKAASAELLKNPQFLEMMQKAMGDEPMPKEGDPAREKWLEDLQKKLQQQQMEEAKRKLEQPVKDEEGEWMWIVPEPGFCIKAATEKKDKKIFINICKHARIAEPKPLDAAEADPEMADAIRFKIPLSCGAGRPDFDKKGAGCVVYDVVVNPTTIERCGKDNEFRRFVAALCMTWIKQKSEPNLDADQFTNVNIKCKGALQMQRIRLAPAGPVNPNAMGDEIKLPTSSATGTIPTRAASTTSKPLVVEVAPTEIVPTFEVIRTGNYDWSKHKMPTKNSYFREVVPETMQVTVTLPGVSTIKEVDVQLEGRELRFVGVDSEDGTPFYRVSLPFPVDEMPMSSKFVRASKTLTLTLRVVLPDETIEESRRHEAQAKAEAVETAQDRAKRLEQEKIIAERRERMERIEREEKAVMEQRKAMVENMAAVREGRLPPPLQAEIDAMPNEQAHQMLMRVEQKIRRGDSVDELLEKLPADVLDNLCRHIRKRLGLVQPEAPAAVAKPAAPEPTPEIAAPAPDMEFNFAKKAEHLFGVKLLNRYVFALEH